MGLQTKLHLPRGIRKHFGGEYERRIVFCEHHESHAASAFYPSPFDEAAILTVDGVGEWTTTSWGIGKGSQVSLKHEIRFPHSLRLLYSAFAYFCGFRVNSGESKLMGLAPYGQPRFVKQIRAHLIKVNDDGSYRLNMEYFSYFQTLAMTAGNQNDCIGDWQSSDAQVSSTPIGSQIEPTISQRIGARLMTLIDFETHPRIR